jgi:glycerophosphoryl diester phosphodiesterase
VIAHRGASAYAPENTLSAFLKAAQLNIKWVEFDVMLSACEEPIIFHDETLNRTTNQQGQVADHTYAYLATLDAGSWFSPEFSGERIPRLSAILALLKDTHLYANIEIKSLPGQDKQTVRRILEEVTAYFPQPSTSILFSSFSICALKALREQSPNCFIGLLMHEWVPDWQIICQDLHCISVHVNQAILTPDKVKKIKDSDRMVLSYTVNHPFRAQELFSWGVDAVFSDAPDRILV